jgi:malonate-semialdehyde dehydrogenase (acetylating)/methylmalonate-semialdehyde dehydrogenase
VAIISPFNFPAMVPCWFFPIAIAAGNTVVLKPSEKDPSAANWFAELWAEAGLPAGVFNVVHGDKVAVDALLAHPGVRSVSFVGSTPVARHVYETATHAGKRVQALGGKNHMVVCPTRPRSRRGFRGERARFRPAGAAWRSRPSRRGRRSPTTSSRRSPSASGASATRGGADMGPLITCAS